MQRFSQLTIEEAFGEVLRSRRKRMGLTQTGLALKSGLSKNFISFCERGLQQPSLNSIFLLAIALKTEPATMIDEVQDMHPLPRF